MATLAMQSLGCEVAALNTVHFSNHTGYRQFKGTKSSAQEITNLYEGLRQSYLTDFDVLLTGYAPSATAVEAVGAIAMDLKKKASKQPGSFFWVLDPVMGDQGRIYVNEDVVPAYKALVPHADLILPNQFEAELLSGIKITSAENLVDAVTVIHRTYNVPHVIVTSVQLPGPPSSSASSVISLSTADNSSVSQDARPDNTLAVFGSTMRSDRSARLFKVEVPRLDCFFSGTGDMFGALMVGRLREAVFNDSPALRETASWISPDNVATTDLPLAKATEKVLASMHTVLEKTMIARNEELARYQNEDERNDVEFAHLPEEERKAALEKRARLRASKAAEVRLVRNVEHVRHPVVKFKVREWNQ
ncbi:pyridoxal kinase [Trichophyton interdigitale MR816]|uniref:pyridoxal kinase n=1 Tax=Trichophyton interdigitale (strain MR816) TaxID=1215338 RepID=A0A059JF35_TRIIM|nr:pyridoxal kinase [Trichophyton interdigitale H6]KDB26501.1 pyridoxal kinase [Trichophyton interdigitale MR816]